MAEIDMKTATQGKLVAGDYTWGSDSNETAVKVITDAVGCDAVQTLTAKTLTSPVINTPAMGADSIDAITEIAAALKSGSDATLCTGTKGADGDIVEWNADGDLVTGKNTTTKKEYVFVSAAQMTTRTSGGAAAGTIATVGAWEFATFDFDMTTSEAVGFWHTFPIGWEAATLLQAKFFWTATAGAGNVKWDISAGAFADSATYEVSLGTLQSPGVDALESLTDVHITPKLTAGLDVDNAADGLPVFFNIARDTATDNLSDDAKLIGVQIEYTTKIQPTGYA